MIAINDLIAEQLRGKTIFTYSGKFNKSITDNLITQLDEFLNGSSLATKVRKKIFNISIEVLQNLYHYLESKESIGDLGHGAFSVTSEDESVQIVSANFIALEEVNSLKSRIDIVNTLGEESIANFYRGVLEIGGVSSKGGAGLGLIDIRKKSGNDIEYLFSNINDTCAVYILKITI